MKSVATIAFDTAPSRWLMGATLAVAAAAAIAPWLTALSLPLRILVSALAVVLATRAWLRFRAPPFRRIAWRPSGWDLVDAAGTEHAALLVAHSRLAGLVTLRFRHAARARFDAVLAPDNIDPETRRRLILLLARADVVRADVVQPG